MRVTSFADGLSPDTDAGPNPILNAAGLSHEGNLFVKNPPRAQALHTMACLCDPEVPSGDDWHHRPLKKLGEKWPTAYPPFSLGIPLGCTFWKTPPRAQVLHAMACLCDPEVPSDDDWRHRPLKKNLYVRMYAL